MRRLRLMLLLLLPIGLAGCTVSAAVGPGPVYGHGYYGHGRAYPHYGRPYYGRPYAYRPAPPWYHGPPGHRGRGWRYRPYW